MATGKKKSSGKAGAHATATARPSAASVHSEIEKAMADARSKKKSAPTADQHHFDAAIKALGSCKKVLNIIWPW
jgi:hypothetical protein